MADRTSECGAGGCCGKSNEQDGGDSSHGVALISRVE
jgi:hypothetical protein